MKTVFCNCSQRSIKGTMSATRYLNEFGKHLGAAKTSTPLRRSLSQLQRALLEYATKSSRLLFIQDPNVYLDFNYNNESEFNDYSATELCEMMLKTILPNVDLYHLAPRIKNRLKYLEIHPCFEKTPHGYHYKSIRLGASYILQPTCDFSLAEQLPTLLSTQHSRPIRSIHRKDALTRTGELSQTVLFGSELGLQRQLSTDIAALLSAIVSNSLELSANQMHSASQIKKRLQGIKLNFQKTGNALPYSDNLDKLVITLKYFGVLKKHLVRSLRSF